MFFMLGRCSKEAKECSSGEWPKNWVRVVTVQLIYAFPHLPRYVDEFMA